jgi:hypothetical protein
MKRGLVATLLSITAIVLSAFAAFLLIRPKPVGGELFAPDFRNGFHLYVVEEHIDYYNPDEETPHNTWTVIDEGTKDAVYQLFDDMKSYIEHDPAHILLGDPPMFWVLPETYFITESYGYRIRILDWRNYRREIYAEYMRISELYREPVLYVDRIDMALNTENEDYFDYLSGYIGQDSLNSAWYRGWISTMPRESFDELLSLLNSIDSTVAEVYSVS